MNEHKYCEHCKVNIDNWTKAVCECGKLIIEPIYSPKNLPQLGTFILRDDMVQPLKSSIDTVKHVVLVLGGKNPQLIRTDRRSELIATVLSVRPTFKERTIDRVARDVKPLFVDLFPKYFEDDNASIQEQQHKEVYANGI